ncbi:MAG: hypothetical protein LUD50_03700 [Clostridia bacterium]|nr:hypothetical protein [Clostridia bacterium]
MDFIKRFFKSKGVEYYLMIGAFACGIAALIAYCLTGADNFTPNLDSTVTAAYIIFIVLALGMCVYEIRIVKFITAAVGLYAFLMYIVYKINYLASIIAAIDGTPITAGFVCTLIFGLAAWILSLVSGCLMKTGFKKPKEMLS